MDINSEGISLLKSGIMLPHYRILSSFLDDILKDQISMLDINCNNGSLCELIQILYPYNMKYMGIDEREDFINKANEKRLTGSFRATDYSKMRLKSNSYDVVCAQGQFLDSDNILEKIDLLFRVARGWVILFNFLVLPEYEGAVEMEMDNKLVYLHGLSYIKEILAIMEPTSIKCSFVVKTDDPAMPTPSIFAIKI
jgi:ubiquinone/menaquinone biosynthesis C-methylase UbiE